MGRSDGTVSGATRILNNGSNANRGFIWRNGAMVDIATLLDGSGTGWTILDLTGINDSGSVVGTALTPGGQPHGILLTYIPEPSAFALAATAGAIALRRRRH